MNLRQKTSRYCAAVLFFAGIAGAMLLVAFVRAGFEPEFEIWLASALVVSLILHARAGFALSRAQQEIELLRAQAEKIVAEPRKSARAPAIKFEAADNVNALDAEMLEQVRSAIENDRVDLYLQPIVSLPQRKHRYFEAYSRLRKANGRVLRPAHYLDAAERANRIGVIDNLILLRAVQALRNLCADSDHHRIFCNISPATIFDQDFFARFSDFLDSNVDLASRLVFEFTSPAVEMMNERVEENLGAISARGFAFSIDHIRRLDLDWRVLREKNFRYVKASSGVLVGEYNRNEESRARVKAFAAGLCEANIDLIVEKVETEAHMPEILSLGIDYGQGDLFGAPRPAPDYISSAPRPAADYVAKAS